MRAATDNTDGHLTLQFVPDSPGEVDAINEAWALIRKGYDLKIRFEDFEAGIPQIQLHITREE